MPTACLDGDLKLPMENFEQLSLNNYSSSKLELVLVVRHIFKEQVNGRQFTIGCWTPGTTSVASYMVLYLLSVIGYLIGLKKIVM